MALLALPYLLGFVRAPHGFVFLGALNNLGDIGQYLAALRQGTQGHLLYLNQYSSQQVAPVLIYPLYTATGLLLGPLHLPILADYYLLQLAAAVALLWSLWQLCSAVHPDRPLRAYALALYAGGLYFPALLLSGLLRLPFAPVTLTAPEFSLFATALLSPHGSMGLAAELLAWTSYLRWRRAAPGRPLLALALAGLVLGLSYPFGLPVLLAVVACDTLGRYLVLRQRDSFVAAEVCDCSAGLAAPQSRETSPHGRMAARADRGRKAYSTIQIMCSDSALAGDGPRPQSAWFAMRPWGLVSRLCGAASPAEQSQASLLRLAAALAPALAIALYYALLFGRDPNWGGSNMLRLPLPNLAVLAAAFGLLLALALVALKISPTRFRANPAYRLAATWTVLNGLLLLAPLPQAERLLSGWSVALALLAALALAHKSERAARRWLIALALSNVTLALLYTTVTWTGANRAYYASAGELAAVHWLDAHTGPRDVVMASAGSGNLIVAAARAHVVVGQNFETFHWAQAQSDVLRFYAASTSRAERAAILRRHEVTLLLDGPYERTLGRFTPARDPAYWLAFSSGAVQVFAVTGH